MATKKAAPKKAAPKAAVNFLSLVSGQVVKITAGKHKGQAGQVRGLPDAKGLWPLMVSGQVVKVSGDSIEV